MSKLAASSLRSRPPSWLSTSALLLASACSAEAPEKDWGGLGAPSTTAGVSPGEVVPGAPGVEPGVSVIPTSLPTNVPGDVPGVLPTEPGSVPPAAPTTCTTEAPLVFRVIPRLNRDEYNNTVRDLLGDTTNVALTELPADQGDGAFDNNTAALSTSPILVETYFGLAEKLATAAMTGAGHSQIVTCDPTAVGEDACAKQIAETFGARGYRRPLDAAEVSGLLTVYSSVRTAGFTFDDGVTGIVQAVLTSPNFLYRPELDGAQSEGERRVSGFEMASRLSYYLWSTMPDAVLTASAEKGELDTTDGIAAQVTRMLEDAKSDALYRRFPALWLRSTAVDERPPAPEVFPDYSPELGQSMVTETSMFMREFMTSDVDFLDYLDADFTYADQRLATLYGLSGTFNDEFQRVSLAGNAQRGGILTQGSVLRVTSPSERTSPVMRGAWILARILNTPAPPPPDELEVPELDVNAGDAPLTTRARLELHRANSQCAGCHNILDPLGFGLEHYDGIGAWREQENGVAVDATSMLTTGEPIDGEASLATVLKADPRTARGIVSFVFSYALGRLTTAQDTCRLDALNQGFAGSSHRMQQLLASVALDDAMAMRRVAP